jgi:hypothetical protein
MLSPGLVSVRPASPPPLLSATRLAVPASPRADAGFPGELFPEDGKTFDAVLGKELSNPIPGRAGHGTDREAVPYGDPTDMDSPTRTFTNRSFWTAATSSGLAVNLPERKSLRGHPRC